MEREMVYDWVLPAMQRMMEIQAWERNFEGCLFLPLPPYAEATEGDERRSRITFPAGI